MNHKQKLSYTVLGAVIMLVGLGLGTIVSPPLIAQRNGVFDTVRCNQLAVVDKYGKPVVAIVPGEEDGNGIALYNPNGEMGAVLHASDAGNNLLLYNQTGEEAAVTVGSNEQGSKVVLLNKKGETQIALIAVSGDGRVITLYNEDGKEAIALTSFNNFDMNSVNVYDKAGQKVIGLDSNIVGNRVQLYDKAGNVSWEAP